MAALTGPIQHKRGTSTEWAASTIPLRNGEIGYDTTVKRIKVGDGATLFPGLPWATVDNATIVQLQEIADAVSGAVTPTDAVVAAAVATPSSASSDAVKDVVAEDIATNGTPIRDALNTAIAGAVAEDIATDGTPIRAAVDAAVTAVVAARAQKPTLGDATLKRFQDTPVTATIVLTGHSLIYGQDTSATGTDPGASGSTTTRNPRRPAVSMAAALAYILPGASVVDQGFPGDRVDNGLTRWAGGTSGDVEVIWYETNEALQKTGVASYRANLITMVERTIARGSQPVLIGGAPTQYPGGTNRMLRAYTAATRAVAARYGAPFYDVAEFFQAMPNGASVWATGDMVHFSTEANNLIGYKLASIVGPYVNAVPKAAPGVTIYPIHGAFNHNGSLVERTTEKSAGRVLRLTSGQVAALPVEVVEPCVPIFDFRASSDGNGVGTGGTNLYLNLSGDPARPVNIPTHTNGLMTSFRGHSLRGVGVETIMLSGGTGSLELERIRFVRPEDLIVDGVNENGSSGRRASRSRMAGTVIGPVRSGASGWDAVFDDTCPAGGGQTVGTDSVDFDFAATLPPSGGRLAIAASLDRAVPSLIDTGYMIRRHTSALMVYENTSSGVSTLLSTVSDVFPATGSWTGVVQFKMRGDGQLVIAVDGTDRYTVAASKWRHFVPGALSEAASVVVSACDVRYRARG